LKTSFDAVLSYLVILFLFMWPFSVYLFGWEANATESRFFAFRKKKTFNVHFIKSYHGLFSFKKPFIVEVVLLFAQFWMGMSNNLFIDIPLKAPFAFFRYMAAD